ncbi:pre-mRNA-splicing factor nucampholin [Lycorma delicatula]|uniref:pre-mRNA-splicing factor nucampholin n=1 Tax=Lycorma delicatula TaxID=130591 RepID=UPI003F513E8D
MSKKRKHDKNLLSDRIAEKDGKGETDHLSKNGKSKKRKYEKIDKEFIGTKISERRKMRDSSNSFRKKHRDRCNELTGDDHQSDRAENKTDSRSDSKRTSHKVRYHDKHPDADNRIERVGKRYYEPNIEQRKESYKRYDDENTNTDKIGRVGKRYYETGSNVMTKTGYEVLVSGNSSIDEKLQRVGKRYYDFQQPNKSNKMERNKKESAAHSDVITPAEKKTVDLLTSRTGGAYIPPAKLRMMQANITDKTSAAYQRIAWEALKKSIHGQINKVTTENIGIIVRELLRENIVRGRGLLCRSIVQAQAASPTFTNVYAALVAVINSKFPNIGELLLTRCVIQFRRGYKRNDKVTCISAATFIAHLVNQRVAHEILALEILTLLVETPTEDSVEVAIAFLKECGHKLNEVSTRGMRAIFEMLRNILHEGQLNKKVQYMIEVMFQVWKDGFKDHLPVVEKLDLVEEEDQFTHLITLDEAKDGQDIINVFKYDAEYEANEEKYKTLQREILGESDSGSESGSEDEGSGSEEDEDDSDEDGEKKKETIFDNTETNLVALRKTIYLTIHSSLDFEECAHKLLRMELKPGQEIEMCHMFLDCCAEQRTYEKFFGLLAQRFCQINKMYVGPFEQIFKDSYSTIHRVETNKLRNVAKLFAHLLYTDAISWEVLSTIRLNEDDTTSSSRIFIKILFQELSEYMGLAKLNQRVKDPTLQTALEGLFPRDNPKNTRFAINFFTSIGLGGLTDELREHLKTQPKQSSTVPQLVEALSSSSDSSSTTSSSTSSSSSSESSSSEESSEDSSESSSESDNSVRKRKNKKNSSQSKQMKLKERVNKEKSEKNKEKNKNKTKNLKSSQNVKHKTKR